MTKHKAKTTRNIDTPHKKYGHKPKKLDDRALLLLIFVFIVFSLLAAGVWHRKLGNSQVAYDNSIVVPKSNGSISITGFGWTDSVLATKEMYTPPESYKLISVKADITNISLGNLWLAPSIESYIEDEQGNHYGMALAELSRPLVAGEYAVQSKASGELSYAMPKVISHPKWCYALAATNGGGAPICFALDK